MCMYVAHFETLERYGLVTAKQLSRLKAVVLGPLGFRLETGFRFAGSVRKLGPRGGVR